MVESSFSEQFSASINLAVKYPAGVPVEALDGEDARAMLYAGLANLERHRDAINALNVFPVPDGDTGTNMLLTMQAACREIVDLSHPSLGDLLQRAAHGALMGARGNSGVILSQILRGMARALDGKDRCAAEDLVQALSEGTETAYKGVSKPVEGTILTVVRRASEAASKAASMDRDLRFIFDRLVHEAAGAVQETPSLLPVLAQAGVVDSGGQGLYVILEGMLRCLQGEQVSAAVPGKRGQADLSEMAEEWGYDIQYLILTNGVDVDTVRRRLVEMGGKSVIVVGGDGAIKVHVHSDDPGPMLSFGASLGHLDDIVVENMTLQTLRHRGGQALPQVQPGGMSSQPEPPSGRVGVVAVVPGDGLRRVFESLGAHRIVTGGQTMNPSTRELLDAIETLPYEEIIVLPNNGNVIMAAQQARVLSSKRVEVIPSRTIPQGISALLALNPQESLEENEQNMEAALQDIETGEVTIAVRAAKFDGIKVEAGDVIGLHNGILCVRGQSTDDVVMQLLERMHARDAEVITIYYGKPVPPDEAQIVAEMVQTWYPDQEVELVDGGQPHYHYILSVE
ncbi:MAG: DAK2 domain-containing protein [Anaerolineae bacterium]|nr:DAK2 domain-containing protein [Anaerolineae bacterium]